MMTSMTRVTVRFVIGELSEEDVNALNNNEHVISKMILTHEDHRLFRYSEDDRIEVETDHGNRCWCKIVSLETLTNDDGVIVILTLLKDQSR
jgi:hypothetical protein